MLKKIRSKLPRKLRNSKIWEKSSKESQQRLAFDKEIVWQERRQKRIPSWRQFKYISSFFSARERFFVMLSLTAIFLAVIFGGYMTFLFFVQSVPAQGGSYDEALIGYPIYINPILANTNDVDLDLSKLIFSGLLKYDKNQTLQPDLAESWEVTNDGKTYTVKLRDGATWHDGEPVTIEDVLFTYRAIQDPAVNSPLQLSLQGVRITKVDEASVQFDLDTAFNPFESILTVGLLPQHLWSNLPSSNIRLAELNIKPIGSGPFRFSKLEKDRIGNIHNYTVKPYADYYEKQPYVQELTFRFYPDFATAIEALNNGNVEGMSFVPRQLIDDITSVQSHRTYHLQLPQYTALFFNQANNEALKNKRVRQAIAYSINRDRLVEEVIDGLGVKVDGPLLPDSFAYDESFEGFPYNPVEAQRLLDEAGWKSLTAEEYVAQETEKILQQRADEAEANAEDDQEEPSAPELSADSIVIDTGNQAVFRQKDGKLLTIRLTTVDQPENIRAAEIITNAWQSIGFKVEQDIIPVNIITSDILPSRDYEVLLYGQILNVFPDLYAFWHSSQIEYPGLNWAGYADGDADELLERARTSTDREEQVESFQAFQDLLGEELPAIFLYSPQYTYLLPRKINGFDISKINIPADRWNNIEEWYIKTKKEWK